MCREHSGALGCEPRARARTAAPTATRGSRQGSQGAAGTLRAPGLAVGAPPTERGQD